MNTHTAQQPQNFIPGAIFSRTAVDQSKSDLNAVRYIYLAGGEPARPDDDVPENQAGGIYVDARHTGYAFIPRSCFVPVVAFPIQVRNETEEGISNPHAPKHITEWRKPGEIADELLVKYAPLGLVVMDSLTGIEDAKTAFRIFTAAHPQPMDVFEGYEYFTTGAAESEVENHNLTADERRKALGVCASLRFAYTNAMQNFTATTGSSIAEVEERGAGGKGKKGLDARDKFMLRQIHTVEPKFQQVDATKSLVSGLGEQFTQALSAIAGSRRDDDEKAQMRSELEQLKAMVAQLAAAKSQTPATTPNTNHKSK